MKYCGIDLHSDNSVVMVSDEEDRIVYQKRLPNDLGQIRAALEVHQKSWLVWLSRARTTGTGWWTG